MRVKEVHCNRIEEARQHRRGEGGTGIETLIEPFEVEVKAKLKPSTSCIHHRPSRPRLQPLASLQHGSPGRGMPHAFRIPTVGRSAALTFLEQFCQIQRDEPMSPAADEQEAHRVWQVHAAKLDFEELRGRLGKGGVGTRAAGLQCDLRSTARRLAPVTLELCLFNTKERGRTHKRPPLFIAPFSALVWHHPHLISHSLPSSARRMPMSRSGSVDTASFSPHGIGIGHPHPLVSPQRVASPPQLPAFRWV